LETQVTHFFHCFPALQLLASLCSAPSLCWGPSTIHLCLLSFCVICLTKSSANLVRLTVTSVSELETDWRLVCHLFWLCFVCPGFQQQQTFQTSNNHHSPPSLTQNPRESTPQPLKLNICYFSFPCVQKTETWTQRRKQKFLILPCCTIEVSDPNLNSLLKQRYHSDQSI